MPASYQIVSAYSVVKVASPGAATQLDLIAVIPNNADIAQPAVLQLMAHPLNDPEDLRVDILLNGNKVLTYGPSSADFVRSFHAVVRANVLVRGNNALTVKRVGGTGTFGFSEIVIWFQESVALRATKKAQRKSATSKMGPKRTARKQSKR